MNVVRRQHIFTLSSVVHVGNRFFYSHIRSPYQTDGSMCSKSIVNILFEYFRMWFHPVVDMFASCALSFATFFPLRAYHQIIMKTTMFVEFHRTVCYLARLWLFFCVCHQHFSCERIVPIFKSHTAFVAYVNTKESVWIFISCAGEKKQHRFENNKEQQYDVRLAASWSIRAVFEHQKFAYNKRNRRDRKRYLSTVHESSLYDLHKVLSSTFRTHFCRLDFVYISSSTTIAFYFAPTPLPLHNSTPLLGIIQSKQHTIEVQFFFGLPMNASTYCESSLSSSLSNFASNSITKRCIECFCHFFSKSISLFLCLFLLHFYLFTLLFQIDFPHPK